MRLLFLLCAVLLYCSITPSCKKKREELSPNNTIYSFTFRAADNPSLELKKVTSVVGKDTIHIAVPGGTDLTALTPDIEHNGIAVNPATKVKQNFSRPVIYNVIAENGNIRKYVVVVRFASAEKEIVSFVLKGSDNPTLGADITGTIENDTIRLLLPVGSNPSALLPTVEYQGAGINVPEGQPQNLSVPVIYIVSAEDGTQRKYTVFASSNALVYSGSYDGYLYALDGVTGRLRWRLRTDSAIWATPIIHENTLYIGSRNGWLYNLNPATGAINWKYATELRLPIFDDPVFYKGNVLFSSVAAYLPSGSVYSLNPVTQQLNWKVTVPNALHLTMADDMLFCSVALNSAHRFNPETGEEIWQQFLSLTHTAMCVADGLIYSGDDHRFVCMDALTGTVKWSIPLTSYETAPVIENGILYADVGRKIYSMSPQTGAVNWIFEDNSGSGYGLGAPAVYNGTVYACSRSGLIYAINAADGTMKWKYGQLQWDARIHAPEVTVANNIVYAGGGTDSTITALHAETGAVIWKYKTGGYVYSGQMIVDAGNNQYLPGVSGNKQ